MNMLNMPIKSIAREQYIKNLGPAERLNVQISDLFHKLSHLNYSMEHTWLTSLDIQDLKNLYYELGDLWTYRLDITMEERKKIVTGGIVFADAYAIMRM